MDQEFLHLSINTAPIFTYSVYQQAEFDFNVWFQAILRSIELGLGL